MLRRIVSLAPGPWIAGLVCFAVLAGAPREAQADPVEKGWTGDGTSLALPATAGGGAIELPDGIGGGAGDRAGLVEPTPPAPSSAGACRALACPWWAGAALERGGHPAVLPNAPPRSLVRLA